MPYKEYMNSHFHDNKDPRVDSTWSLIRRFRVDLIVVKNNLNIFVIYGLFYEGS